MASAEIELIVRAVVTEGSRVLLARSVDADWYFLPGGHVEPGEPAADALRRELGEELGVHRVRVGGVVAIVEAGYADDRGAHHEVNLVHQVAVDDRIDGSREAHLAFEWLDRSELDRVEVRPAAIAELLRTGLGGPEIEVRSDGLT